MFSDDSMHKKEHEICIEWTEEKGKNTIYYCKTCINICWNKEWKIISVLLPKCVGVWFYIVYLIFHDFSFCSLIGYNIIS